MVDNQVFESLHLASVFIYFLQPQDCPTELVLSSSLLILTSLSAPPSVKCDSAMIIKGVMDLCTVNSRNCKTVLLLVSPSVFFISIIGMLP